MTILQALENALEALESLGYTSGDIHDDLSLAISRLKRLACGLRDVKRALETEL